MQCFLSVAALPITRPPQWLERLKGLKVTEGQGLVLRAQASGLPCPALAWQKVGHPCFAVMFTVSLEDGHSLEPGQGVTLGQDGEGGAWLVVEASTAATAGWYQLTAFNTAGSSSCQARVVVETLPGETAPAPRLILPTHSRVIEPQ